MTVKYLKLVLLSVLLYLSGCSSSPALAPVPDDTSVPRDQGKESETEVVRTLWGAWRIMGVSPDGYVVLNKLRAGDAHFNITSMLQPPACDDCLSIEVTNWDQVEKQIQLKATLRNKTNLSAYDVRGIVMSSTPGLKLTNADAYTNLWDDGGDIYINPFKAFAVEDINRKFAPDASHSRSYEILYPSFPELLAVLFVVDVSWPTNCREPFAIDSFVQTGDISIEGGSAQVKFNVYDWQFNAEKVFIDATPIGGSIVEMTYVEGYQWVGNISTPGPVEPGTHTLRVWASSAQTSLKLYNYFEVPITACAPGDGDTWQSASNLTPGNSSGAQLVCQQDKEDWYYFNINEHVSGELRLELLNATGKADLTLYNDPMAYHLRWIEIEYGTDAVIDMSEFAPGVGMFFARVRHIGPDSEGREYILHNSTLDSLCYPGGDDSYLEATSLPQGTASGSQLVCLNDKQDWFKFTLNGPAEGELELTVTNGTGPADLTLYSESQAPTPGGPNIKWKEADPTATIDLAGLGLATGTYYIRVRHIGSDEDSREYVLSNGRIPGWVRTWEMYYSVTTSHSLDLLPGGEIIITGSFTAPKDLDPGPGEDIFGTEGEYHHFMCKLTPDGDYTWGKSWGNTSGVGASDMKIDLSGYIYVTGSFIGSCDLDPGPGVDMHTSADTRTNYVSKFDSSGNYLWGRSWPGTQFGLVEGITVDPHGNIYIVGMYGGEVDFDPGPGYDVHTSAITDLGQITYDAFLTSFDTAGLFRWAKTWGGKAYEEGPYSYDYAENIAMDSEGGIYVLGGYAETVDFDPGPGISERYGGPIRSIFLSKFDDEGTFHWVDVWGLPDKLDTAAGLVISPLGWIYVSGTFRYPIDLNPAGGDIHTSVGGSDGYLSCFNLDGEYQWAKIWGNSDDETVGSGLAVTSSGDILVIGSYRSPSLDLDPGPGTDIAPGRPGSSMFFVRLNNQGQYLLGSSIGASTEAEASVGATNLEPLGESTAFAFGSFSHSVDFDAGPGVEERTTDGAFGSLFLMRLAGDGAI